MKTALMWAAEREHKATVQALLSAGANVGIRDKVGFLPFFYLFILFVC